MKSKTSIAVYFIVCLIMLSIELELKSSVVLFIYYSFVLVNLANAVRLVTNYDNNRYE